MRTSLPRIPPAPSLRDGDQRLLSSAAGSEAAYGKTAVTAAGESSDEGPRPWPGSHSHRHHGDTRLRVVVIRVNLSPRRGTWDTSTFEQHLHERHRALPRRSSHFGIWAARWSAAASCPVASCLLDVAIRICVHSKLRLCYFPGTALMRKLDSESLDSDFNSRIPAQECVSKLRLLFFCPSGSASSCAERENRKEYSGRGEDAGIPSGGIDYEIP